MKSISKLLFTLAATTALLVISSCEDTGVEDLSHPTITVLEPAMGEEFAAGSHVHFEATLEDDVALAAYEIEIHDVFDGHEHKRISALSKWSFKQSFEAGGVSYQAVLEDELAIPMETLAGPYHLIVKAVDAQGNATTYQDGSTVELEIIITNESQALVSLDMEAGEDELEGKPGEALTLSGTITDAGNDAGIEEVVFILGEEHDHDNDHDHKSTLDEEEEEVLLDFDFENSPTTIDISTLDLAGLIVPAEAEDDEHKLLTIKVFDVQGNITIHKTEVHVHAD